LELLDDFGFYSEITQKIKSVIFVIPAKAGIYLNEIILDSRLRGNDTLMFIIRGGRIRHVKFV
jgi:hypothetical protein